MGPRPVIIGITGATRSGKSWVSRLLCERLGLPPSAVVGQDPFWRRAVRVRTSGGEEMISEEEPECTDHGAFAAAIRAAVEAAVASGRGHVIAEGFQLVHDERVSRLMDHAFFLELGREACIARRSAPRGPMNPNPMSVRKCENLVWPAHERYVEQKVRALGDGVQWLRSPTSPEEAAGLVETICAALSSVSNEVPQALGCAGITERAPSGVPQARPVVIGLTGSTRSGKSWVARLLGERLSPPPVTVVGQDGFWCRAVRVRAPDGEEMVSEEEPDCTDHGAFAAAIERAAKEAATSAHDFGGTRGYVIAEGFQLVHDERVPKLLDHIFFLELDRDACIARRSAPCGPMNPNPMSVRKCEALVWPAHERYVEHKVRPLGGRVSWLRSPSTPEEAEGIVDAVCAAIGLGTEEPSAGAGLEPALPAAAVAAAPANFPPSAKRPAPPPQQAKPRKEGNWVLRVCSGICGK